MHDLYCRTQNCKYIMAAGDSHGSSNVDLSYPHQIVRTPLLMSYRGIASAKSIYSYARQTLSIIRLVKAHEITEMHAARPLSEGLVAALVSKITGLPYLCYSHGEDINIAKCSRELTAMTNFVLKNAKAIIANSNHTAKLLEEDWHCKKSKIEIMHPGVCSSFFSTCHLTEKQNHSLKIITVGRLQARKGQDTVIRALPEIQKHFKDVTYTIVGNGKDKDRLAVLTEEMGVEQQVSFLHDVPDQDLPMLYSQHDVFAMPNRAIAGDIEGFGIVFLEAQASGLPVIAGNSGGTADTLRDGETGFLVDGNSPEALVKLICEQLDTAAKRRKIGENGRRFVASTFDWKELAKKAETTFDNIFK